MIFVEKILSNYKKYYNRAYKKVEITTIGILTVYFVDTLCYALQIEVDIIKKK